MVQYLDLAIKILAKWHWFRSKSFKGLNSWIFEGFYGECEQNN
jgi:hypothetical protein